MTNAERDTPISQTSIFVSIPLRSVCAKSVRVQRSCVSAEAVNPRTAESATVETESASFRRNKSAEESIARIPQSAPAIGYCTFPQEYEVRERNSMTLYAGSARESI